MLLLSPFVVSLGVVELEEVPRVDVGAADEREEGVRVVAVRLGYLDYRVVEALLGGPRVPWCVRASEPAMPWAQERPIVAAPALASIAVPFPRAPDVLPGRRARARAGRRPCGG